MADTSKPLTKQSAQERLAELVESAIRNGASEVDVAGAVSRGMNSSNTNKEFQGNPKTAELLAFAHELRDISSKGGISLKNHEVAAAIDAGIKAAGSLAVANASTAMGFSGFGDATVRETTKSSNGNKIE